MEGNTFDTITRTLAAGLTRRRMLGGLIGTTAAVLAGAATLEAKPMGKAKGKNKTNGNGGNGRGAGTEKVQICHRNNGRKGFKLITVGSPAAAAHERHGDTVCEPTVCQTVTGCEIAEDTGDLACVFGAVEDNTVACETDAGDVGTCVGGECVAEGGGTNG
jgi:hypothetical protein